MIRNMIKRAKIRLPFFLLTALTIIFNSSIAIADDDNRRSGNSDDDNRQSSKVREYWVAAEKVMWDYAPEGNLMKPGEPIDPWDQPPFEKLRFIQYTDGNYDTKVPQPEWMGILGPQLRAVVGDTIVVHFLNREETGRPLTMHPHGVKYNQANDGADFAKTGEPGAKVAAGDSFTYNWKVDKMSGPGRNDPSSKVWLYHSHVDSVSEIYAGLIGTIVVIKKGFAKEGPYGPMAKDVDIEYTTMFMIFNEFPDLDDPEPGLMHTMNGYIFGNLKGYVVNKNDRVRWNLIGMGTEVDLHTAHWHGEVVDDNGRNTDVVELMPATMRSVDMVADNPGTWLYHCHVTDHISAGMMTRWTVNP